MKINLVSFDSEANNAFPKSKLRACNLCGRRFRSKHKYFFFCSMCRKDNEEYLYSELWNSYFFTLKKRAPAFGY